MSNKEMYRITSVNSERCVEMFASVYEKTPRGSRGWYVTEFFDSGVAYREKHECPTTEESRISITCDVTTTPKAELGKRAGFSFNFDEGFDQIEQAVIIETWLNQEAFTDNWIIEDQYIKIPAGFKVDLIKCRDDKVEVIEQDLLLCEFVD